MNNDVSDKLGGLLVQISYDMTSDDLAAIKSRANIPAGIAERIARPLDLWDYFEREDNIVRSNEQVTLDFLKKILDPKYFRSRNNRLLNHVLRYEGADIPNPTMEEPPVLDDAMSVAFEYLSLHLNRDWRRFFRRLGIDNDACEALKINYPKEKHSDMIYIGLHDWFKTHPGKTISDILEALEKCELNLHRDKIRLRLAGQRNPHTVT